MEELISQLLSHLKGIWKYRWYATAAMWVIAIAGWLTVSQLPDKYESSARIYVDTQSVLKPLMAGMVSPPNLEQQVTIMSRTLISRPNVERVMRMVDLDIKAKSDADREAMIKELMSNITIRSTDRDNLFTIAYDNEDKKIAKGVVQSLLTIFVEGTLGDKKQDSTSAIRFIDEQIKEYEEKLIAAETALTKFKQANAGLLPNQSGGYATQLTAAAESLAQARLDLKEAEQSRDALKKQVPDEDLEGEDMAPTPAESQDVAANPELDSRIQALNKNLDGLRLQFTELHPDIVSTKRLIKQLEERKKEEAKLAEARRKEEAKNIKRSADPGKNYSPMLQQLNIALAEAEARVASMRARADEYARRYNQLKAMSNAVPEVETALSQLNRDYEVNKSNYDKLLERRESAKMSGEMANTTELLTFKIIDPPTAPQTPTAPNRPALISIVLLVAMGGGAAIAFLMSQVNPSFHTQNDLRETTGYPILGTVTMIWTDQEIAKRKKALYAFFFSLLILIGIYGGLMAMVMPRTMLL